MFYIVRMDVPVSLCVKRKRKTQIFKVLYRQVFYRRLMHRVLYYSTTSHLSVCKWMQPYNSHRTQCAKDVSVNTRTVFLTILWSNQLIHRCQPRAVMFIRCARCDCQLWPHRAHEQKTWRTQKRKANVLLWLTDRKKHKTEKVEINVLWHQWRSRRRHWGWAWVTAQWHNWLVLNFCYNISQIHGLSQIFFFFCIALVKANDGTRGFNHGGVITFVYQQCHHFPNFLSVAFAWFWILASFFFNVITLSCNNFFFSNYY